MKRNGDKYIKPETKKLILEMGYTQSYVANYIGMKEYTLNRCLLGNTVSPIKEDMINKLCELLKVDENKIIYTYYATPDKINDREEWKELTKDGCNGMYLVSNMGRVWSVAYNHEIKQGLDNRGYPRLTLEINKQTKGYKTHRLIAETFIPNPNKLKEVNHIDGNKENNNVSNLEWVTSKENVNHAFKHGLHDSHIRPIRVIESGERYSTIREFINAYNIKSQSLIQNALKKGKSIKGVHIEYV